MFYVFYNYFNFLLRKGGGGGGGEEGGLISILFLIKYLISFHDMNTARKIRAN